MDTVGQSLIHPARDVPILSQQHPTDVQARQQNRTDDYQDYSVTPIKLSTLSGTTFPTTPNDGEIFYYQAGAGVVWQFKYNASSTSIYNWEFVGGSDLYQSIDTGGQTWTSSTYIDIPNGQSAQVTLPFDGDYDIFINADMGTSIGTGNNYAYIKVYAGGSTLGFEAYTNQPDGGEMNIATHTRALGIAAGIAKVQVRQVNSGIGKCFFNLIRARPVRVKVP